MDFVSSLRLREKHHRLRISCISSRVMMMMMIPSITSSYHDNHDYASSAFPVGSGTGQEERNENAHYASAASSRVMMIMMIPMIIIMTHPQHYQQLS